MYSELLLAGQQTGSTFTGLNVLLHNISLSCAFNIQLFSEATFVRESWPSRGIFDGGRMVVGMTKKERCNGGRRRTVREEENS